MSPALVTFRPRATPKFYPTPPAITALVNKLLDEVNAGTSLDTLTDALTHFSTTGVLNSVPWDTLKASTEPLSHQFQADLIAAASREAQVMGFKFDPGDPHATAIAAGRSGRLITDITAEQGNLVRHMLDQVMSGKLGGTPQTLARQIRRVIGLHRPYARAVLNYEAEQHRQAARLRLPGSRPSEARLAQSQARLEDRVARYAARLRRVRSETIARTEGMGAANGGKVVAWGQAVSRGLASPQDSKRWITAPEGSRYGRPCTKCAPMANVEVVGLASLFYLPNGQEVLSPPAHPDCRCVLVRIPPNADEL